LSGPSTGESVRGIDARASVATAAATGAAIADVAALKAALDAGDRAGWRIEVKRGAEVLTLEVSR